jgi:hypothetical protein
MPGHAMVTSLVALGLAVGGRYADAELMAERAMSQGKKTCGGLATWAQCHVFDGRGGVSEGISAMANFDGMQNYEGCGFLFFDCRLSGYGARFSIDREERGRGKSAALRLYEAAFDRVLRYSGFAEAQPWQHPQLKAPYAWTEPSKSFGALDSGLAGTSRSTIFDWVLGRQPKVNGNRKFEISVKPGAPPSLNLDPWEPSCEDVLTWLPPTPALLADATLLLLRMTLNGTISSKNGRWEHMRKSWSVMLDIERKYGNRTSSSLQFCPLCSLAASILFPPSQTGGDSVGNGRLAMALFTLGELLQLGDSSTEESSTTAIVTTVAETDPTFWLPAVKGPQNEWKSVVDDFMSEIDGFDAYDTAVTSTAPSKQALNWVGSDSQFCAWEFDARPILEHAVVYACCKTGDVESLSLARAICSQGVTLRPNSPEEWWRYSIVLGLLGDQVGSEDALFTSMNVGSGQGGRN